MPVVTSGFSGGQPGLCYGRLNLPAAAASSTQLKVIHSQLPAGAAVYSSPLTRCLTLARQLYPTTPIITEPRVQEMHFGEWEGVPWDDIPLSLLDEWAAQPSQFVIPGGESFDQLIERVSEWLEALLPAEQPLVVITHAGVMRALSVLQGVSVADALVLNAPFGGVRHFQPIVQ